MDGSRAPDLSGDDLASRLHRARMRAFLSPDAFVSAGDGLDELLGKAARVYAAAITPETRATYARRWRMFTAWCEEQDLDPLPAAPEAVMLYLAQAIGEQGAALGTLRGWVAAIARVHIEAGFVSPTEDPAMTTFLKGLSRLHPPTSRPEPVQALRIGALREVCRVIDAGAVDPVETRDRAILGLHVAGVGDGEIARLCWPEVRITPKTVRVTLLPVGRQRGTRVITVRAKDEAVCPVAALRAWLQVVGEEFAEGPVFRLVDGGRLGEEPMKARRVFSIRKSRLDSLGTPGEKATPEQAMRLLGRQPPMDVRDRAILLLGFAGAFRRNEITRLRWSDFRYTDAGILVRLRQSKTDAEGRGRDVGIPYGRSPLTCPVKAVQAWQNRVRGQLGEPDGESLVFVHVGRAGRITTEGLSPEALTRMVIVRAEAAGLEGKWGGRSLRAGFISTAADLEVPLEAIATQSRHATLDSLILYVRRQDPFRRNPAGRVGL